MSAPRNWEGDLEALRERADWRVSKRHNRVCTADGVIVAQVYIPPGAHTPEGSKERQAGARRNAALISAAPDMQLALEACLELLGGRSETAVKMAADALAKASDAVLSQHQEKAD